MRDRGNPTVTVFYCDHMRPVVRLGTDPLAKALDRLNARDVADVDADQFAELLRVRDEQTGWFHVHERTGHILGPCNAGTHCEKATLGPGWGSLATTVIDPELQARDDQQRVLAILHAADAPLPLKEIMRKVGFRGDRSWLAVQALTEQGLLVPDWLDKTRDNDCPYRLVEGSTCRPS